MIADAHHRHPSATLGDSGGPTGTIGPVGLIGRDPLPLAGRTVLVTGVSRRIGISRAVAHRTADYGADTVTCHYRSHDASQPWGANNIDAVVASVRTHPIDSTQLVDIPVDLAAIGGPARVVEQAAAAAGHLDILVCSRAMSSSDGSLSEITEAILDAHRTVDARVSILLAQAFAAQEGFTSPAPAGSARRRGSVVFLTSGQGLDPPPGEITYTAAKAAIVGLTLTISGELIDIGITVNTINPGLVGTSYVTEEDREVTAIMFPQGHWDKPDDAARLITWLLTDEARWITGQVINSEGGFTRWRR